MKKDSCFIIRGEDLEWKSIGEETLILNPKTGNFYQLNQTATFIWNLLDKKRKKTHLLQKMTTEFDVKPEDAEKDLDKILSYLHNKKLIIFQE